MAAPRLGLLLVYFLLTHPTFKPWANLSGIAMVIVEKKYTHLSVPFYFHIFLHHT
jgi:hypothetical protein